MGTPGTATHKRWSNKPARLNSPRELSLSHLSQPPNILELNPHPSPPSSTPCERRIAGLSGAILPAIIHTAQHLPAIIHTAQPLPAIIHPRATPPAIVSTVCM